MSTYQTTVIAHVGPGSEVRAAPYSDEISDADGGDHVGVEILGTGIVLVGRPAVLTDLARRIAEAHESDCDAAGG